MSFRKTLCGLIAGATMLGQFGVFAYERNDVLTEGKYSGENSFSIQLPAEFPNAFGRFDCEIKKDEFVLECKKDEPKRASFSFDDSRFLLAQRKSSDSDKLMKINGADGRIAFKSLLGYENFVFVWGAEHQAIMADLKIGVGGGRWGAAIIGASYHITSGFRFYFGEENNMFASMEVDHLSDRLIKQDIDIEEFFLKNPDIKLAGFKPIDVVSLQLAQKLKISNKNILEYRLGHNLYQTTSDHMFSAMTHKNEQLESYPYKWFFESKGKHSFADKWKLFLAAQSEFGGKRTPADFSTGIEKNFFPYPFGIRWFYGLKNGRDKNSIEKTRFGISSNGEYAALEAFGNFGLEF